MQMPVILGAGRFDSTQRFSGIHITRPRTVTCYELEFFFEDSEGVLVINNEKFPVKKGSVLFSKPGDVRYSHLHFKCDFLHFDKIPSALFERLKTLPPVFEPNNSNLISQKITEIIKNYCSVYSVDNISALAELLLLLKEVFNTETVENSLALKAKRIIHNEYSKNLNVEYIAEKCNISASYLHKIYAETFGIGPAEALLNRRIRKAKEFIINTDLSFFEIALNCGFNSQSYFSACFKNKTGVSPKDFRKMNSIL